MKLAKKTEVHLDIPRRTAESDVRMSMRRFTRLTNAFSKKLENHAAMVSLYFMYYNFGRVRQTLRVTLAMEAGISDHVWAIEEIIALLQASEYGCALRAASRAGGRVPKNGRGEASNGPRTHRRTARPAG
jgi:hypothetical protein